MDDQEIVSVNVTITMSREGTRSSQIKVRGTHSDLHGTAMERKGEVSGSLGDVANETEIQAGIVLQELVARLFRTALREKVR